MNIYALEGHRVKVRYTDMGYDYQIERARKYLTIGEIYTVEYTEVHSESTEVFLKEVPDISFNSACFEDVTPQSEVDDKSHEDYARWNN